MTIFLQALSPYVQIVLPYPLYLLILLKIEFSLFGIMSLASTAALLFLFFGLYLLPSNPHYTYFFLHCAPNAFFGKW